MSSKVSNFKQHVDKLVPCDLSLYAGFGSDIKIQRYSDKSFTIGSSIIGCGDKNINGAMCLLMAIFDALPKKYLQNSFGIYSPWGLYNYLSMLDCPFHYGKMQDIDQITVIAELLCVTINIHISNKLGREITNTTKPTTSDETIDLFLVNSHFLNSGD